MLLLYFLLFGLISAENCNFENGQTCELWKFTNSKDVKADGKTVKFNKNENFRVVVGSGFNNSNHYAYFSSAEPKKFIPMVISLYFQHTVSTCELVFRHQVHGLPGAELLVTTQHLDHKPMLEFEDNDEEKEDWVRPTFRASYRPTREGQERWVQSRVPVGQILYPTRIRIECHSAKQQKDNSVQNVECRVDDIQLENCDEEVWSADSCSSKQMKKYLCTKSDQPKCIDYADVCDMIPECENDEDEDLVINKCDQVPQGARCDFEDESDTGCEKWRFQKGVNSTKYLKRISMEDTMGVNPHGLPPDGYFYHGTHRKTGHFLFFSTFGAEFERQSTGEVFYISAFSPTFPATSPKTNLIGTPEYKACMVRFFFCHTGASTFQLMLERGDKKEVLWTPPKSSGAAPCNWQKAAVVIPYQPSQYRLKLAFAKLYKQPLSVAIDDLTMTPYCFSEDNSWDAKYLPDALRLDTLKKVNDTVRNSWSVKKDGLYYIELYGAAGGKLSGSENNNGGSVKAEVTLSKGQEVKLLLGQRGESPCSKGLDSTLQNRTNNVHYSQLYRNICSNTVNDSDLIRKEVQNLFGTGGGGASAVYIDNKVVIVAGGGGGVIPSSITPIEDVDARGGVNVKNQKVDDAQHWASGFGYSFSNKYSYNSTCSDCRKMNGRSEDQQVSGGSCPRSRIWSVNGGLGGGGASCGPGAGGGGGFYGGKYGFKSYGSGGSSSVTLKDAQAEYSIGVNEGDGRILLMRCALACPDNSTCKFEENELGTPPKTYCLCANGKETDVTGDCKSISLLDILAMWMKEIMDFKSPFAFIAIFGTLIFFILLIALLWFCCRRGGLLYLMKRYRFCWTRNKRHNNEFRGLEMSDTIDSRIRMSDRITPNPIYERLTMMELPQISRHFLQLKQSIGHGAFGEVYEGLFILDGRTTRVAVKTLPMGSNPETDIDFESEARLLNHFDHPNIVKFYGVSFEKLPKYIILEYLEGGDLRNFLREQRPKDLKAGNTQLKMVDLLNIALDVAYGCEYLEQSKFIHRDIAARNCLLTSKGPDRVVKIADFGMARDIFSQEYYRKGGRAFLAVKWMPPEAFLDGIFNSKTDVWAYGVLLWEIFSMGYMPYTAKANQDVMQLVVAGGRLEPPVGCPQELYNEMLRCWHTEADARPNFTELVNFFTMLASDPVIANLPLPPILHTQRQNTPSEASSSLNPTEEVGTSQATNSTVMTESTTNSSVQSMPTKGEGVSFNVFPPYESRCTKPLMELRSRPQFSNREPSLSSHDDSTLHDTCSVKQSPYKIEKEAFQRMSDMQPNFPADPPPTPPPRTKKRMSPKASASSPCFTGADSPMV
ncbi:unnamed protein product [Bursaphelenchus okinawaensis]|uniref:receptor protein-tyrosine kinase n=1 Tax=Bursaphelenchus okinawaensis TaxID=465554 RepID=A0A811L5U9_9BILA|nr:unnamed protein product [Bursaphelenchus okinawaensis]CAG9119994.1 unnamed protein product [Bursaphelenchus okinawaensis]